MASNDDSKKEPHAVPNDACNLSQRRNGRPNFTPDRQALLRLRNQMLEWLGQYNCNRGAADCIPGAEALIRKIEDARLENVVGHLFHAHLVRGFHESDAFDVNAVEVRISQSDKRPKDIRLLEPDTREYLFVESWHGKSPSSHAWDKMVEEGSGNYWVRLEDDARNVVEKYKQLPPGKGFVINYAIGTNQSDILPIAKMCTDKDKCVITARSDMRAYIYGPAGFRHMEDVRRICEVFGWCPQDMLGRLDSADVKVNVMDTISVSDSFSFTIGPD